LFINRTSRIVVECASSGLTEQSTDMSRSAQEQLEPDIEETEITAELITDRQPGSDRDIESGILYLDLIFLYLT